MIFAVFAYEPLARTVATMFKVALLPLARLPIDQVDPDQLPEGVALTNAYPEGSTSFTVTPVALLGPLLVAVKVNVIFDPTVGV